MFLADFYCDNMTFSSVPEKINDACVCVCVYVKDSY